MKVTRKLVAALVGLVVLILAIDAAVQVRREVNLFDDDLMRDTRVVGEVLAPAIQRIWRHEGRAAALRFLAEIDRAEKRLEVRWREPGARGATAAARAERDERAFTTAVPVTVATGTGTLEVREPLDQERAYVATSVRNTALATGVIIALCAAAAGLLGTVFVGKPTRLLVDQARRIGAGDLRPSPPLPQRDELGELSSEMNAMCARLAEAAARVRAESEARLHALEQLRHADRLTTVGTLASGIAHELGTPLNIVDGRAQLIADGELEGEAAVRANARIISQQAQRMTRIIRQLLDFARRGAAPEGPVPLRPLCAATTELLAPEAQRRGVTLEVAAAGGAPVARGDMGALQQVLTNLVMNALQASDRGGQVSIELEERDATPPPEHGGPPARYACVTIRDRGRGMDPETLERVFEPFFTTKGVGEGTGLGLSVAYGIVRDHRGWIEVTSRPGQGTTFAVFLEPDAA